MGDIADILGLGPKAVVDESAALLAEKTKKVAVSKKKPKGMSREVFDLVGSDSFVSTLQPNVSVSSFKNKRTSVLKGKWIWDAIKNSARGDKDQNSFFHWVKADVTYPDYPYAKFNIVSDEVLMSREQYDAALDNGKWSYEDTVNMLQGAQKYSLRWPVVYDRLQLSTAYRIEEIQARYYQIAAVQYGNQNRFNLDRETNRRLQQNVLFRKTKEDEAEETKLREELKTIDAALKKMKKTLKPTAVAIKSEPKGAAGDKAVAGDAATPPAPAAAAAAASVSAALPLLSAALPVEYAPAPGRPALQSGRLLPNDNTGLSKNLTKKVSAYLAQLSLPARPAATRAVCDAMDNIRRDTSTLLSLHSAIAKKEKDKSTATLAGNGTAVTIKTEKSKTKPVAEKGVTSAAATATGEQKPKKASTKRKSGVLEEAPVAMEVADPFGGSVGSSGSTAFGLVPATVMGNKQKKVCL